MASSSPFYTFLDQMLIDAKCEVFVVWCDPESLIFKAVVNTFLYGRTQYLPVHARKDPGPCWRHHRECGVCQSIHSWFTDIHGCPQMNKIFLCCVDILGHTVTGLVLSGINPYTSMLVYRKYSYTDGTGLYTITSLATWYLPVYTRNQQG
jgi:hypothetical protein